MAKKEEIAEKMKSNRPVVNGKKVTPKMEHKAKQAGWYKHGDPRFGDVYEA